MSAPDPAGRSTTHGLSEVVGAIQGARRIAVVSHRDPDPDTIGSGLALGLGLEGAGKHVSFHCADPVPEPARFLESSGRYTQEPPPADVDLIVTVDFGDLSRAKFALPPSVPVACIDHHASNAGFGAHSWVDATSASCCELVIHAVDALGLTWTPAMATAALTGIMTDTGSLQFPATDGRTYRRAAQMREAGADLQAITYNVFRNKRFEQLQVRGKAFGRMRREQEGLLVWSELHRDDLVEIGAREDDVSGTVEQLAQTGGSRVTLLFHDQAERGVKVSCRTSEWPPSIDAAAVMGSFGGGGHLRAAGALIPGTLGEVRERVLAAAREAIAAARRLAV